LIQGERDEHSEKIKSQAGGRQQHLARVARRAEEQARKEAERAEAEAAAAAAIEEESNVDSEEDEAPVIEITLPDGMEDLQ
jgi:hypothetical protein